MANDLYLEVMMDSKATNEVPKAAAGMTEDERKREIRELGLEIKRLQAQIAYIAEQRRRLMTSDEMWGEDPR